MSRRALRFALLAVIAVGCIGFATAIAAGSKPPGGHVLVVCFVKDPTRPSDLLAQARRD